MGGWGVGRLVLCGLFAAVCWLGVLAKKGWNGLELLAAVAEAAQRATL